jgi:hypothetical protein
MVSRAPLPITFLLDGHSVGGETLQSSAGAQVFVLTSCSAELGIELRSAYLGAERSDRVLVAESTVVLGEPGKHFSRYIEQPEEALLEERRRLLYDHLQRLQELALEIGFELAFAGIDRAIVAIDPSAPRIRVEGDHPSSRASS